MAIKKNAGAEDLLVDRWFNFSEGSIKFQPVSDYFVVDVHSFKAVQGFYKAAPCAMDDLGDCRMCSTYDLRKVLFTQAWDEQDGLAKYLKLSKSAARQFIELIEAEKVEPTTTLFQVERWFPAEASKNNPKFNMRVVERDQLPKESDLGDMYEAILTWMDPEYLKRFVPGFAKLVRKYPEDSGDHYVEINEPDEIDEVEINEIDEIDV